MCVCVCVCVCLFENGVWSALSLHCLLRTKRERVIHTKSQSRRAGEATGEGGWNEEETDACLVG